MIWFFLMGMIAGAVGLVMLEMWYFRKHVKRVTADEMIRDIKESEEEDSHE